MTLKTPLILATLGTLALTACTPDPNAYPNDPNARTRNGALFGCCHRWHCCGQQQRQ